MDYTTTFGQIGVKINGFIVEDITIYMHSSIMTLLFAVLRDVVRTQRRDAQAGIVIPLVFLVCHR